MMLKSVKTFVNVIKRENNLGVNQFYLDFKLREYSQGLVQSEVWGFKFQTDEMKNCYRNIDDGHKNSGDDNTKRISHIVTFHTARNLGM